MRLEKHIRMGYVRQPAHRAGRRSA
jgi:hypothetical protein